MADLVRNAARAAGRAAGRGAVFLAERSDDDLGQKAFFALIEANWKFGAVAFDDLERCFSCWACSSSPSIRNGLIAWSLACRCSIRWHSNGRWPKPGAYGTPSTDFGPHEVVDSSVINRAEFAACFWPKGAHSMEKARRVKMGCHSGRRSGERLPLRRPASSPNDRNEGAKLMGWTPPDGIYVPKWRC